MLRRVRCWSGAVAALRSTAADGVTGTGQYEQPPPPSLGSTLPNYFVESSAALAVWKQLSAPQALPPGRLAALAASRSSLRTRYMAVPAHLRRSASRCARWERSTGRGS